jgi:hypothetical protein
MSVKKSEALALKQARATAKRQQLIRSKFELVWTPESQALAVSIFREVLAAFREADIEPLLIYGSLLGACRNGKIIPWDGDIDITVDYTKDWAPVAQTLEAKGLHVFRSRDKHCLFDRISSPKTPRNQHGWQWPWVDVYPYKIEGENVNLCHQWGGVFYTALKSEVFPLTQITFEGVPVATVKDPELHLSRIYPDWQTHYESPKVDHRNAVANSKLAKISKESYEASLSDACKT